MLDTTAPTPLQQVDNLLVKRDDLFKIAGVCGGKARTCWAMGQGASGLVTASSRSSPQANIAAHVAKALGVPCRVHVRTRARTGGRPGRRRIRNSAFARAFQRD